MMIGGGVAIYPHGWDSVEIQQACGNASDSYHLGKRQFTFWIPKQKQIIFFLYNILFDIIFFPLYQACTKYIW